MEIIAPIAGELHAFVSERDFRIIKNGWPAGWKGLVRASVIEGAGLFIMGWSAYLHFFPKGWKWQLIIAALPFLPFLLNLLFQELRFEQRVRGMEEQLPDALILWAALPAHLSFEQALHALAENSASPLKEEWIAAHARMRKTGDARVALEAVGERVHSIPLEVVKRLLVRGYVSGVSIRSACTRLAEALMVQQSFLRERQATLMVEKYTILVAGGLLVPTLLGVLVGVVERLPLQLISENAVAHQELFAAALLSIRGYLFIYACIAGTFVGWQSKGKWKTLMYVLVLIPLAQIAFQLGKWWMGN